MTDDTLDMATLARFAILPGASTLMRAFAEIPPGPMRDAVIYLAVTTASTYSGAPAQYRMPDPIAHITPGRPARLALETRTGREPPGGDWQTEVVKMRMAGQTVPQIMAALSVTKQQVYSATYDARKAGLKIPKTFSSHIAPGSKTWVLTLDELSATGLGAVKRAAGTRGVTTQAYLDRRHLALKLAQEGAGYETILKATGERSEKVVSVWLSAARAAGYKVPYVTFIDQHEPPAVAPDPPQLVAQPIEDAG